MNIKKIKKHLIPLSLLSVIVMIIGFFALQKFFPLLFSMSKMSGSIPFIRNIAKLGMPYGLDANTQFLSLFNLRFLTSFGLLIFMPLISLLSKQMRKTKLVLFSIGIFTFTFCLSYFVNFNGSELALNKYFIPFMISSTLVIFSIYNIINKKIGLIIILLLAFSVISQILYFASISNKGVQQYWKYSDRIIEYLNTKNEQIVVVYDDTNYAKYIINNLNVNMIYKIDFETEKHGSGDYYISSSEIEGYELVEKTDTKYLYKL